MVKPSKYFVDNIPLRSYCKQKNICYATIIFQKNKNKKRKIEDLVSEYLESRLNRENHDRCMSCLERNCSGCPFLKMKGEDY